MTNHCTAREVVEAVPSNGRFLFGALSAFPPEETMRFFEGLGVPLKTERGNRVFPVSDQAADIVDAPFRLCAARRLPRAARRGAGASPAGRAFGGCAPCLGGGAARPGRSGGVRRPFLPGHRSTGDGYRLARQAGHTVTELRPSLVPLVEQGHDCAEMTGLSLRNIGLSVWDTRRKKEVYTDFGELLFTAFRPFRPRDSQREQPPAGYGARPL